MICRRMLITCLAGAVLLTFTAAEATSINYGNFGPTPPGVGFLNVTESSGTDPVPLYGPPIYQPTSLTFHPTSFVSSGTGGASDITEGQLNAIIAGDLTPPNGAAIQVINLSEAGDYTLVGTGTTATGASAGAILRATVLAIDGLSVAPIALTPVNASVGFNLVANAGLVQPWALGLGLNVQSQLTALGIPFQLGATRVDVVIDNALVTTSEPGSVAFVAKKQFALDLGTLPGRVVPEPGMACLLGLGLCGLAARRRAC
jgi:hypothetical protein